MSLFGAALPQEKVYVHMDNTCYFLGDTLWYKGYVTRADHGTLTNLSRILYAELLTPDGYLVERQQLEMTGGTAHGMFVLPDSLYAGYYELRAYTRWMLNFGRTEHPHTDWVEAAFYNKQMADDFFRDYEKLYSRVFPVYDKPGEPGHFAKDMTIRPLRRYFKGRDEKPAPDLRFYPEGGCMVDGTGCRVAMELNDREGRHLEGTAITIVDKDGREVARCTTEEASYDNGTMLTEMLLASEIRGFVENPGYYFEADDTTCLQALDRLMMVQGWRRHKWREMAGKDTFQLQWLPEKFQTLQGSVHHTYSLYTDNTPNEKVMIDAIDPSHPILFYTTAQENTSSRFYTLQDLYSPYIRNLGKEVHVVSSFAQGTEVKEFMQKTENGTFYMQMPRLYGDYTLTLTATDAENPVTDVEEKQKKGYTDETQYPDYYVKLANFYPRFPQPYSFYQTSIGENERFNDSSPMQMFTDRLLPAITVRNKRSGMRRINLDKPAVVLDAYSAYNLATDYGLNGGKHDWRTFSTQIAVSIVGDMGLHRHYHIREWFDGRALTPRINKTFAHMPDSLRASQYSISDRHLAKYKHLRNLDKLYIYTDYAPREEGSWKYEQDNQPEVIIDYRLFPDGGYQHTFRDRHYVMRGYAVCDEFYSPDYSRRPLPDSIKDHRRTLLWMPHVCFDRNGTATVRLYNNGKPTSLSIEAEGVTAGGKYIS